MRSDKSRRSIPDLIAHAESRARDAPRETLLRKLALSLALITYFVKPRAQDLHSPMKKFFLSLVLTVALIAGGLASFNPDAPPAANESQASQEQTQTDTGPQDQTGSPTESSVDQDDGSSPEAGESPDSGEGPPTLVPEGSLEDALGGSSGESSPERNRPEKTDLKEAHRKTRDNYNAVLGNEDQRSEKMSAEEYNRHVDTLYQQQRSNYEAIIDGDS